MKCPVNNIVMILIEILPRAVRIEPCTQTSQIEPEK